MSKKRTAQVEVPPKKIGRPADGVERVGTIYVKLTAAEDEAINARVRETGLSRTQIVLGLLFTGPRDAPTLKTP